MELLPGHVYFIKDAFFEFVQDPYLMRNYPTTMRPHYYAIKDGRTGLYWMIPCSSKVEKYERIIAKRQRNGRETVSLKITQIAGKKAALLLQDMFPVSASFVEEPYFRGGQAVQIANPNERLEIDRAARRVIRMLRQGTQFTRFQPDALRIEQLMLESLEN